MASSWSYIDFVIQFVELHGWWCNLCSLSAELVDSIWNLLSMFLQQNEYFKLKPSPDGRVNTSKLVPNKANKFAVKVDSSQENPVLCQVLVHSCKYRPVEHRQDKLLESFLTIQ